MSTMRHILNIQEREETINEDNRDVCVVRDGFE
jgi:hypothetical protein